MVEVTLTWFEAARAAEVGVQRQIQALARNLPDAFGYEGDGWAAHIEGAAGEMALAKAMNWYWGGTVNTFKHGGDVGNVQVRTRTRDHYELIVRDNDRDDDVFYLVTGTVPTFRVVGWILGKDAKRPEFSHMHGGRPAAYFVPHNALREVPS